MKNVILDLHTHSNFSPDASDSAEKMCYRAVELGLKAYAITDHCDCNFWFPPEHYAEDNSMLKDLMMYGSEKYSAASICEQKRMKDIFSEKLELLCGIELGQPLQNPEAAEKIVSDPDIDFIIGSHHQNSGKDDFYWIDYNKMDLFEIYSLLDDYFSQMLEMCRWGKFDVLGHLTYPLRYIQGDHGIDIDLGRYEEMIRQIYKTLISGGKGIEINTSGLRQKYGMTFPTFEYIKLYRELGGEIITVGSDSHCTADIGKGVAEGIELAKSAGFEYISYFKKHRPIFISLK